MTTLSADEIGRIKAEVLDNVLDIGAIPYVSIRAIYDTIQQHVVSSTVAPTTSSTAVTAPGAAPDIIARDMLARNGVDPDSINIVNAGGSGARIQALAAGKIDATASSTQFIPDADKLGIRVMALASDLLPEYPRFVIIAQEKTLKAKREATINFLAAYMEGLDYSVKHRDETLKLSGKINEKPATDPQLVYIYDELIAKKYVAVKLDIPRAKIEWLQNQLLKVDVVRKKIDLDKFIDDSYREEALKRAKLR